MNVDYIIRLIYLKQSTGIETESVYKTRWPLFFIRDGPVDKHFHGKEDWQKQICTNKSYGSIPHIHTCRWLTDSCTAMLKSDFWYCIFTPGKLSLRSSPLKGSTNLKSARSIYKWAYQLVNCWVWLLVESADIPHVSLASIQFTQEWQCKGPCMHS